MSPDERSAVLAAAAADAAADDPPPLTPAQRDHLNLVMRDVVADVRRERTEEP